MPTNKQILGEFGERVVCRLSTCPKCKRESTLRRLPVNFKCADIICDFCGYLAQVKTASVRDIDNIPPVIQGAAWGVQLDRMSAGIYFPLYLVLVDADKEFSIFYLPADLQGPLLFRPRKPLSASAKRAGWQGFTYNLRTLPPGALVRMF